MWRSRFHLVALVLLWQPASACLPDDHEELPLGQQQLDAMMAQVLSRHPQAASSPGIKHASADRVCDEYTAYVVFHPHTETAGIRAAYEVECASPDRGESWICGSVRLRRYLSLETQEWETRVTGPIETAAAMALIEATRKTLPLVADGAPVPGTARNINSWGDEASVTIMWVDFDGEAPSIFLRGQVAEGGDPTRPDDWIVSEYPYQP